MAKYAHIENNTITGVYDLLPDNWRNISNFYVLAENFDDVKVLGWRVVQKQPTPLIDINTQRYGEPIFNIVDNEVIETIEIINLPVVEPVQPIALSEEEQMQAKIIRHDLVMSELRKIRDKLLADTDKTQLQDLITINGPELTQQFADYRQLLRDLPSLYENDLDFNMISLVEFPVIPGV